jgi:hypothetical protein
LQSALLWVTGSEILKTTSEGMQARESRSQHYQIKVIGKLDKRWAGWFDGMSIDYDLDVCDAFVTTLTGAVADQAALHGLLTRIRDLNLRLISVVNIDEVEGSNDG